MDPRTPVIIGAGQFTNREASSAPTDQDAEHSPVHMMALALQAAEAASGARVASQLQSIAVVPTVSWRYSDPAAEVARLLGANSAETVLAPMGGHAPTLLLNRLAKAISAGAVDIGAVVGGESWRTRNAYRKLGSAPPWWSQPADEVPTFRWDPEKDIMFHPAELAAGLIMPTQMYPLFENALRHESGRSFDEHQRWVGSWWAPMSKVAVTNPYAWKPQAFSAAEVAETTPENRMVGYPYTKRMVSNPDVDMSAGFIMCSAAKAQELGVPKDRWIFAHAGTDGVDRFPSNRSSFTTSASMRVAGRRVLELAGRTIDDIDLLDVYSCFPSAIEIASKEIGIPLDRPLTVYGGLCFAGGPWNNPVNHALAAMWDRLTSGDETTGLVTSNGGNVGKHGFVVLSSEPPDHGFKWEHPQAEIDAEPEVGVDADYEGPVTIETWTVMYDRRGEPETAHAAVRTPAAARRWARTDDADALAQLVSDEWIGRPATVSAGTLLL